jgi:tellurite resistance protein
MAKGEHVAWVVFLGIVLVIWLFANSNKKPKSQPTYAGVTPGRENERNRSAASLSTTYESDQFSDRPTRAASGNRDTARWIAYGDAVTVAGHNLYGGLIYVGQSLSSAGGYGSDNCLINPALPVAKSNPDTIGSSLHYWPSYAGITPSARLAYLKWLAGGRTDPAAGIGYVFLFFYGLERRVFVDRSAIDTPAILAEVRRLLSIYGENGSFRRYAQRFLEVVEIEAGIEHPIELHPHLRNGYEIPLHVRVHLGKRLKAGEPLGSDEALMWVLALPDTYPRTAAVRCFDEFRALWAERFKERWKDGLTVRTPKSEIRATYQPASGTFSREIAISGLPDIAAVTAPTAKLRELLEACTTELDPYSRFIGRAPERRTSLEAALLLPDVLQAMGCASAVGVAREQLAALVGDDGIGTIPLAKLQEILGQPVSLPSPAVLRQTGASLDRLGFGFEPDRRFGGAGLAESTDLVVFRTGSEPCDPDRPEFTNARTIIEVAALAAAADGVVAPAEFDSINADLQAMETLSASERRRLLAYTYALLKSPPRQQSVLKRLSQAPLDARERISQSAIAAVLADGRVAPEEVKYLERLNKALGLPAEDVYSLLHRGAARPDEPVLVARSEPSTGSPLPPTPRPSEPGISLDLARLSRVRQETTAVSALLADIFVEEPLAASAPAPLLSGSPSPFSGLDLPHGMLLASFLETGAREWTAFEGHARALKLLPEGALETINDWAFEQFDEVLLENDGTDVVAAAHLRDRLKELGAAL